MLVAGEQSGDQLGVGLIKALRAIYPNAEFYGIGGSKMMAEGFVSHYEMERLAVMGFIEPLKRLPELLSMLRGVKRLFRETKPDIFIGIDAPDFNLKLEKEAKRLGIMSVHYVSPSVWAWRQGRIKGIKKSVDLMLCLLPFEAEFYKKHDVPVAFVGHPLADKFELDPDQAGARKQLGLNNKQVAEAKLVALMPGSRSSEVGFLLPMMLDAAAQLVKRYPDLRFVLPAANKARQQQILDLLDGVLPPYIDLLLEQSHEAMTASDLVVMASGTTTLEAMLLKKPMVICYKWPPFTWAILSRLVKVPWVGLPNLLANKEVAKELLQDAATVENLVEELDSLIRESNKSQEITSLFKTLHLKLRNDASASAAKAISEQYQRSLA